MIRAIALAPLAVLAAACGSDLGPQAAPPAVPVRIQLIGNAPGLVQGVRDAIRFVGARRVGSTRDADLVVTSSPAAAARAAQVNGGTHILIVGTRPTAQMPANVRAVEFDRGGLAYLAGALAAMAGPKVAVAEPDRLLLPAFRDGAAAAGSDAAAAAVACGAPSSAAVVYVPDPGCRPRDPAARVIAPRRLGGATMLALLGPRPVVVVAANARAVQDGAFQPGVALESLREDAIGFGWISPAVRPATVDALQHIENRVRAETVPVPAVAP